MRIGVNALFEFNPNSSAKSSSAKYLIHLPNLRSPIKKAEMAQKTERLLVSKSENGLIIYKLEN